MKRLTLLTLAALALITLLCMAQTPRATANIPFSFAVEGKTLDAGNYVFAEGDNPGLITIRNLKTKQSIIAPVITRLQARAATQPEVIFDVAGSEHYLSEVYLPGFDGYLVKGAPSKHTHVSIKAKA